MTRSAAPWEVASGTGHEPGSTVRDTFLALLLADDELIDIEFDAIVAAEWSATPPAARATAPGPGRAGEGPGGKEPNDSGRGRPGRPRSGADGWGRERSPPD